MKVGLVLDHFDPRRGGVEQWTHQFARQLLAAGHEVHVAARGFEKECVPPGLHCHALDAASSRMQFAQQAAATLRRLSLDVVHDTGCGTYADVFQPHGGSRVAAFERNLALMPAWQRPWKRALARFLPRYREFAALAAWQYVADGRVILALSRMVAEDLRRYHNVSRERMRIIYNGVDTERFSPAHRAAHRDRIREQLGIRDETLILIVAHNFRLKGVPTLLRAASELTKAGQAIHVAVAGGKKTQSYASWAKRLGLGGRVTFLGAVNDVVPYYAAADVYAQPTYYDPCSLVVLEALASGLPVITTRWNGAGEIITPGREGEILESAEDPQALAFALGKLVGSERRRELMGEAARQLALKHTLEHNCREIIAVYEEIVRSRKKYARAA